MKHTLLIALMAGAVVTQVQAQVTPAAPAASASAPASAPIAPPSASKKALLDRLVALQQPGMDDLTRSLTLQPVQQMSAFAQQALDHICERAQQLISLQRAHQPAQEGIAYISGQVIITPAVVCW